MSTIFRIRDIYKLQNIRAFQAIGIIKWNVLSFDTIPKTRSFSGTSIFPPVPHIWKHPTVIYFEQHCLTHKWQQKKETSIYCYLYYEILCKDSIQSLQINLTSK